MTETYNSAVLPDWVQDSIFYQIFPDRFFNGDPTNDPPGTELWGNPPTRENFFGGDLQGVLEKLDYLQNFGVNAIYLNPIFRARTNHKYDTCDYYEVDPSFGSNALLKKLIDELHKRDMRIILDGVFNHVGDGFWAFEDVKAKGASSTYSDWFFVRSFPINAHPLTYDTCGGCYYLPKLNINNSDVQEYILKVAIYWMKEARIDGWRLDTPCKVPLPFWRKFRNAIKEVNPEAYLVGEIWREASPWIQGDTFDGITNYRLRELILEYCATGILDAEDFAYDVNLLLETHGESAPYMLNLLGCHDTPRLLTVFRGEVDRLLIAITFLMTTVGAPLIYYGDEIGMMGDNDPDCRRTMIWDETLKDHRIFDMLQRLIALRHSHIALRRGIFESLLSFDRVFAFRRAIDGDEVIVIINPGPAAFNLEIPIKSQNRLWNDPLKHIQLRSTNGKLRIKIVPASSLFILLPEKGTTS
jgi:cyclomaltodextrinase